MTPVPASPTLVFAVVGTDCIDDDDVVDAAVEEHRVDEVDGVEDCVGADVAK